jgi:FtsP/CotA-like multicopper oxidase with cupredoxin domain
LVAGALARRDFLRLSARTPEQIRAAGDEMDRHHEEVMKMFPAPTAGQGNQIMQPRMEGGVKVFDLTGRKIQWQVEPGRSVEAWAYNEQVPGPQIRVREGDRVPINLHNELAESTSIHFHGQEVPIG